MTDANSDTIPERLPITGDLVFPPAGEHQIIYADGIWSLTPNAGGVMKLYLYRLDPSMDAEQGNSANIFAQLIMPVGSFAGTVVFLERQLQRLVEIGLISAEQVASLRAQVDG